MVWKAKTQTTDYITSEPSPPREISPFKFQPRKLDSLIDPNIRRQAKYDSSRKLSVEPRDYIIGKTTAIIQHIPVNEKKKKYV